jgi:hypothetical protein
MWPEYRSCQSVYNFLQKPLSAILSALIKPWVNELESGALGQEAWGGKRYWHPATGGFCPAREIKPFVTQRTDAPAVSWWFGFYTLPRYRPGGPIKPRGDWT